MDRFRIIDVRPMAHAAEQRIVGASCSVRLADLGSTSLSRASCRPLPRLVC